MTREPVLALLDYSKTYEVDTDASDYAIGKVFLSELDFTMEYKPERANIVADALSRKMKFATINQLNGFLLEHIRKGLSHDPTTKSLVELAKEGKTKRFWLDGELLYTHGHCFYVPHYGKLRKEVMKECYDSRWASHPGMRRTLALLEDRYYWPHMGEDVKTYVKTCLVCQQDKVELKSPTDLLQPLPVPERPWESVSMILLLVCLSLMGLQTRDEYWGVHCLLSVIEMGDLGLILDVIVQVNGLRLKLFHKYASTNRWTSRTSEYVIGDISSALCECHTKGLAKVVGCCLIFVQFTAKWSHKSKLVRDSDGPTSTHTQRCCDLLYKAKSCSLSICEGLAIEE
ncbi:hypothetical protein CXB51_021848 [Gossypium anomalum]|uniref:Integrase zinc-binding domain-containing protein n=1 Tax=Gossypium anomalum TaxID=47600 RepID=A0A8J6CS80_9ROSI|nr:hypothetical protein CXB51_021848 [Gossypium anomalum]